MGFVDWANAKVKNFNIIDVQFLKLGVAAFVLMIAKLWQPILALDWYWYLVIALLAAIKPIRAVFSKKK